MIPNLGPTRVSKLLARKRPALFPILDEVIRERLGLGLKAYRIIAPRLPK